jgi:hemoglobin
MSLARSSRCRVRALGEQERPVERPYGEGDATFQACGRESGIHTLVVAFYRFMDSLPEARRIRALHPPDLVLSIEKLSCFLCGWTGGPKRYAERYGPIQIPKFHRHLPVGPLERDAWLLCMEHALTEQRFAEDLKQYLLVQLFVPAERIRQVVQERIGDRAHKDA